MKHDDSLRDSDVSLVWSMLLIINDEGFSTLKTVLPTAGGNSSNIRALYYTSEETGLLKNSVVLPVLVLMLMGPNGQAAGMHYERMRSSLQALTGN